ncbi:MAG: hypothetical protein WDM89_05365 [Rhizomicrobium sp.]
MLNKHAMWTVRRTAIADGAGEILTLAKGKKPLSVRGVIALWRDNEAFQDFFAETLGASPYEAFFWETPPTASASLDNAFECAIISSDMLAWLRANDEDFADHFSGPDLIAAFDNLGHTARLIAPRRIADVRCYGHIAAFVRLGPREQQRALFRCLALEIERRLASSPDRFWVSTAGLGVPWLHLRLDRRPKYYQYGPYKMVPASGQ